MNVRLITKALHTLSLLSDEDYDLVLKLRALTEDEREQFRTALELQKPVTKKTGKKPSKKSERASGIEAQLKERREQGRAGTTAKDDDEDERCTVVRDDGEVCELLPDHNIHHLQNYPLYHEFDAGKSDASTATARSLANGGAESGTANLETDRGAALDAARAAGGE